MSRLDRANAGDGDDLHVKLRADLGIVFSVPISPHNGAIERTKTVSSQLRGQHQTLGDSITTRGEPLFPRFLKPEKKQKQKGLQFMPIMTEGWH